MLVAGIVCGELPLRDHRMLEFHGPGDVVQPPVADHATRLGGGVTLTAIVDSRAILLGPEFIAAAARWPGLMVAVMQRLEEQHERLAVQGVIAHVTRAEHRVLLMLWELAERWGHVTGEGIVLSLPLTHSVLGQLCAARRPTVTVAVSKLESSGLVRRGSDGSWLLTPAAGPMVAAIARTRQPNSFADGIALRWRSLELAEAATAVKAQAEHARSRRRS